MNLKKNSWNKSPPGMSAMIGKENGLFSIGAQFYTRLNPNNPASSKLWIFSTAKEAGRADTANASAMVSSSQSDKSYNVTDHSSINLLTRFQACS
jgi:hypothetical protein